MEYDPATPARQSNAEWQLIRHIHDQNGSATIQDLISRVGDIARGPGNTGVTSLDGMKQALAAFGIQASWCESDQEQSPEQAYQTAYNLPLAILFVDGLGTAQPSFPRSYFDDRPGIFDHFIVWLPNAGGVDNLFNDPMTDQTPTSAAGKVDVRYDLTSIQHALGDVLVLPAPEGLVPSTWHIVADCAVKVLPNHVCKAVSQVHANTVVKLTGRTTPQWTQIVDPAGVTGWVLTANLQQSQ
jgi:hypothetical protein